MDNGKKIKNTSRVYPLPFIANLHFVTNSMNIITKNTDGWVMCSLKWHFTLKEKFHIMLFTSIFGIFLGGGRGDLVFERYLFSPSVGPFWDTSQEIMEPFKRCRVGRECATGCEATSNYSQMPTVNILTPGTQRQMKKRFE